MSRLSTSWAQKPSLRFSGYAPEDEATGDGQEAQLLPGDQESNQRLLRLVLGTGFECFVGIVILFQLIFIAWEVDAITALASGGNTSASDEQAIRQLTAARAVNIVFLVFYFGECGLRWAASRKTFWAVGWNVLDVVVLILDFLGTVISLAGDQPTSAVPRLFRIMRLMRVTRVFIAFRACNELLSALRVCISALLWGSALLILAVTLWSIISVEYLHPLTSQLPPSICIWCPAAFRSVATARATLLQIAFGDGWGDVVRPLIANDVSASIILGSFLFVVCLWLFNMVVGAFLDALLHLRSQTSADAGRRKEEKREEAWVTFKKLCTELDGRCEQGGDTVRELRRRLASASPCFEAMGVEEHDFNDIGLLFSELSFGELHDELWRMKTLEVQRGLYFVQRQLAKQQELLQKIAEDGSCPKFGMAEPGNPASGNGSSDTQSSLQSSSWSRKQTAVFGSYESKKPWGSSSEKLVALPPQQQQQQQQQHQQQQNLLQQQAGWYLYGFYGTAPPEVGSMVLPQCISELVKADPVATMAQPEPSPRCIAGRASLDKKLSSEMTTCTSDGRSSPNSCQRKDGEINSRRSSSSTTCHRKDGEIKSRRSTRSSTKDSSLGCDAQLEGAVAQLMMAPPQAGASAPPRPLCNKDKGSPHEAPQATELADALRRYRSKFRGGAATLKLGDSAPGSGAGRSKEPLGPSPLWSPRSAEDDNARSGDSSVQGSRKVVSTSSVCTFGDGAHDAFPTECTIEGDSNGVVTEQRASVASSLEECRITVSAVRDRQKPLLTFTPERDMHAMLPHRAGTFDEETKITKQIWADGAQYNGGWLNGKAHGEGRLLRPDKAIYEGQWFEGEAHGKGIYFHPDGSVYDGQWEHDGQHGLGKEVWTDGSSFTGSYKMGMKHGQGVFIWGDGSRYEGELFDNRIHGAGFYSWPDGSTYEGQWYKDLMSGTGLLSNCEGNRFVVKYSRGELLSKEPVRYHDAPSIDSGVDDRAECSTAPTAV